MHDKNQNFLDGKYQGITMHLNGFIHNLLCPVIHKKRLTSLILFVTTAIKTKSLSLTHLGRGLDLPIKERSAIRRSDRFLGNKKLFSEKNDIYKAICTTVIGENSRPWIIVDWSEVPNTSNHVLRAAMVAEGRAITLYEEVHAEKKLSSPKTEKQFLQQLKKLFPENCCPVIVTDAGFHNGWFKAVLSLNWNYIGRVRCGKKYSLDNKTWHKYTELFNHATTTPKFIGKVRLCSTNKMETYLYTYKGKHKGRKLLNRSGKKRRDTNSLDHQKSAREAWVLASSLSGRSMAKRIIKIYKKRMQIEEGFRDLKSSQYGFGFENAYSKQKNRIAILLLIGSLASLMAWLAGWIAEKAGLHYQFQSNSTKNRRVLSLFYLGCRVIAKAKDIPINWLEKALNKGLSNA